MTTRIQYARAARADLRDIGIYLRQAAGDAVAEAVTRDIMDAVETLAVMPRRHRTRDSLMPGLRAISVRSYLIFYSAPSDEWS
ncbi:MAG: type II toxin-antitoxin system RelE/ParE family toxin [Alphaproteobacteria bacterium]|nr:type II toxin-antitoxin system RelE/ParE family toxin [Alphaproteobacteria bacterium]